jgi:hypothetical protein
MIFPGNMKKMGPFSPSPSLYYIGSKLFIRNGCKTQNFLACSTNCNTILQFLQGTLETMKRFTTKVICIYARNHNLNPQLLSELHASPTVRHSGFTKTYERVKHSFFWDGMKQDILTFVVECEVCQQQGRNCQSSRHTPTTSDSPFYLVRYFYGFHCRLT